MKVSILGRGNDIIPVVSAVCHLDLISEVVWVDDRPGVPHDVLQDLKQAIAIRGSDTGLHCAKELSALEDSQIVILLSHSSGPAVRPIQVQRRANSVLACRFARCIKQHAPGARVVVAMSPACSLAFYVYRELEADTSQVIGLSGGTASAYLKTQIANQLGVSVQDVTTLVIGNDDTVYPLPQYCRVNGIPLEGLLSARQIHELTDAVNGRHTKSGNIDAPYTLAAWISQIITAIALDKKRIMSVGSLIQSSAADVYLTVPTKIGRNGVESILQLDLTNSQREQFTQLVAKSVMGQN
jgi:malate dehydrogenase